MSVVFICIWEFHQDVSMTLFPVNPKNLKGLGAEEVRRCANTP
jgi:hypothetical protein